MRAWIKQYIVMPLMRCVNCANAKKIKRHRRGTLWITNVKGHVREDGSWLIAITFARGRSRSMPVLQCSDAQPTADSQWRVTHRFTIYGLADFRKPLKLLAQYQSKPPTFREYCRSSFSRIAKELGRDWQAEAQEIIASKAAMDKLIHERRTDPDAPSHLS